MRTRTRGIFSLEKLIVFSEPVDKIVAKIGLCVERSLPCVLDVGRGRMQMSKEIKYTVPYVDVLPCFIILTLCHLLVEDLFLSGSSMSSSEISCFSFAMFSVLFLLTSGELEKGGDIC